MLNGRCVDCGQPMQAEADAAALELQRDEIGAKHRLQAEVLARITEERDRLMKLVTIEPNKGLAGCGYCGNGLGSKKPGQAYSPFHRANCPWLIAREALNKADTPQEADNG